MGAADILTTGQAAERLGVALWQLDALFRRKLVRDFGRVGPYRAIPAAALPEIEAAARAAGYLLPAGGGVRG